MAPQLASDHGAGRGGRPLCAAEPARGGNGSASLRPAPDLGKRVQDAFLIGLVERESCRRSGLYYIENYVWTVDEHERDASVKKLIHGDNIIDSRTLMPTRGLDGREDDFLRWLSLLWLEVAHLLVPKSRQLRISHLMMALHGWLAQSHSNQRVLIQSKKFEDADALLERRWLSMQEERKRYPHIPWPAARRKNGAIIYDHNSIIMAAAQGADIVRSYTFSAIFSDEMAFQEQAEDAFTAAIPTVENGGKYTGVSTANPSFFETMVFDRAAVDV